MELEKFMQQVRRWLKKQGAECVDVTSPTTILFLKDGFWGFLECKASKSAPHRPGQDKTVARHNEMSYSRFVWPGDCWEEVQKELEEILK